MHKLAAAIAAFVLSLTPAAVHDKPVKDDRPSTQRIDWD